MKDPNLVAASAIALAVTLFAIFSMRPWARRIGLVDKPSGRKRHRGHVPTIGGLCFFLGTLVGLSYLGYVDRFVASLMAGGALVVVAGALDDAIELSVRSRLMIEACAVGLVIAVSGLYVHDLGHLLGNGRVDIGLLGVPLTVFAVIGLINAFNMLDGIDGLAAAVAMVSIAAILMFHGGHWSTPGVLLLLQVLFAALIPYLCVNLGWPDGRKIFMGDAGSMLIGFLLAWSVIFLSHPAVARLAPVDVLWCVALPVVDTMAVMYRRVRAGRSPFRPDRQHLHHLLLDAGLAPRATLMFMVVFSILLVMLGYALREVPEVLSAVMFLVVLVVHVLWLPGWLARVLPGAVRGSAGRMRIADARAALALDRTGDKAVLRDAATRVQLESPDAAAGGDEHAQAIAADMACKSSAAPVRMLCVLAAPDAIQMAPIVRQLAHDDRFDSIVCALTDHKQATAHVLDLFGLEPDLELQMPGAGGDPAEATSTALTGIRRVMDDLQPDMMLVPGDASASLAATLAAHYRHMPVVCVDRDMSTGDAPAAAQADPGPHIARTLADLHVVPNMSAGRQLVAEGIPAERVLMAGDPAICTLRAALDRLRQAPALERELARRHAFLRAGRPLLLVLIRGRAPDVFAAALRTIALQRPDVDMAVAMAADLRQAPANLHRIEPPDYLTSIYLLARAHAVVTDRDILAEAGAMAVPALTLEQLGAVDRRVVATNGGGNGKSSNGARRTGPDAMAIAARVLALIDRKPVAGPVTEVNCGDEGDACQRIVEALAGLRSAARPFGVLPRDAGSPTTAAGIRGARELS